MADGARTHELALLLGIGGYVAAALAPTVCRV